MKAKLPRSSYYKELDIEKIETLKSAKFIGDFDLMDISMDFSFPVAVFYQENPPELSPLGNPCSNYFGLYFAPFDNKLMICDAQKLLNKDVKGFIDTDGLFKHSRFRHDLRMSNDNSHGVDGGFAYLRTLGKPKIKTAKLVKDHLEFVENPNKGKDNGKTTAKGC